MLINIANSITQINITGRIADFNVKIISTKITAIDTQFTLLKSWLLISTKSFINGPSPANIAVLSYLFTISFIFLICEFNSSVASSYFEFIIIIWYLSFVKILLILSGSESTGTEVPNKSVYPNVQETPSTLLISFNIWFTL